jgi:hypothetical protein
MPYPYQPNNISQRVQIIKPSLYNFFPVFFHMFPLRCKLSPKHPVLNSPLRVLLLLWKTKSHTKEQAELLYFNPSTFRQEMWRQKSRKRMVRSLLWLESAFHSFVKPILIVQPFPNIWTSQCWWTYKLFLNYASVLHSGDEMYHIITPPSTSRSTSL